MVGDEQGDHSRSFISVPFFPLEAFSPLSFRSTVWKEQEGQPILQPAGDVFEGLQCCSSAATTGASPLPLLQGNTETP